MRTIARTAVMVIGIAIFAGLSAPLCAFAQSVSATPVVIDMKAKPREIVNRAITIENKSDRMLNIYPSVNDVVPEEGKQVFVAVTGADLVDSLANWITVSRAAISLKPRESRTVEMKVHVNLNARPDTYHALITFAPGNTREEAERNAGMGASVSVNMEVEEDIRENVALKRFAPEKRFFTAPPVALLYELENKGNRTVTPRGDMVIYDRKGAEVVSIPVNEEQASIAPGERLSLSTDWKGRRSFGQYKALLTVDYGKGERLQDTVFFWVIPLWQAVTAIGLILLSFMLLMATLHSRYDRRHAHGSRASFRGHLRDSHGNHRRMLDLRSPEAYGEKKGPKKITVRRHHG